MNNYYKPTENGLWQGRIDSQTDFDAFRWHQWIQVRDLNQAQEPFQGALAIAFIGFCSDLGVKLNKGRIGASKGPLYIRRELMNLPCHFKEGLQLFDMGDVIASDDLEASQEALSEVITKIISLNMMPIVLGGGHEVALGNYHGVKNALLEMPNKVGIINFDAHFDLRPFEKTGTSGTMFNQIAEYTQENNEAFSYFCLGIQQRGNTRSLFNRAKALNVEYVLAREITQENLVNIFSMLDRFCKDKTHLYVTICMDVFASAYAPGVSSAQPLGLQPWHLLTLLKYILRKEKTISFDIAEVSPQFDQDNITANLASTTIFHTVQQLAEVHDLDFGDIF